MKRKKIARKALLCLLFGSLLGGAVQAETLDFSAFLPGEVVNGAYSDLGTGPVAVWGDRNDGSTYNNAIIFDSSCTTGPVAGQCSGSSPVDDDLGTPNAIYGGPGVGSGGLSNDTPLGNVLIIAESRKDKNQDGRADNPDDADVAGSNFTFDFAHVGAVTAKEITIIDVDADENDGVIELFDAYGQPLAGFGIPLTDDNGVVRISLGPTADVAVMRVTLEGSAAVDNIVFERSPSQGTCGDGFMDAGEQCDDGNMMSGDGCSSVCIPETFCGDGILEAGEQCDDGNMNNTDGCRNNCVIPACGDGLKDTTEQCDDGNTTKTDGCRNNCTIPVCGDGIKDANEKCDDGNSNNTDGCRNNCILPICGDGIMDAGEQCDDGNMNNADGCRNSCVLPTCGDGIKDAGELCDDGNMNNGDGCSSVCVVESRCGDGIKQSGEQCDDGNDCNTDGCRNNCTIPTCGDGLKDAGEQCDDGNMNNGDGCSSTCVVEPRCGDGIKQYGEQCDDGNMNNGDGCSSTCAIEPRCGDGIKQYGEQCDDGNMNNGDGCSSTCVIEPRCGDGIKQYGEQCDDGNDCNTDGCRNNCTIPACGDGIKDAGEQCDDGNKLNGDGCSSTCVIEPRCGDGIKQYGEQCDDGNKVNGDGCSSTCMIEKTELEGCTPGYWKQSQHFGSWSGSGYSPSQKFVTAFGCGSAQVGNMTLLQALTSQGGGKGQVLRHGVAALLNAAHDEVEYGMSVAEVKSGVCSALQSGNYAIGDQLASGNEAGCPLGRDEGGYTSWDGSHSGSKK